MSIDCPAQNFEAHTSARSALLDSWFVGTVRWCGERNWDALVVVDYSTTWCGPCKVMEPKFIALSDAHTDAVFLKVVGDSSPDASKLMKREGVRSVPSFHYWKTGEDRHGQRRQPGGG